MRRRLLLLPVLLPALLSATACIREPDPTDLGGRQLSVHAVLEAGADSAVVLITRPALTPYDLPIRVSDAKVRLLHAQEAVWLTEDPTAPCVDNGSVQQPDNGDGCYRATLPEPIRGGETYELEITLPDGTTVTGRTQVPAAPVIVGPEEGARFVARCGDSVSCQQSGPEPPADPVVTIPIIWTAGPLAESMHLALRPTVVYAAGGEHPGSTCSFPWFDEVHGLDETSFDWPLDGIFCSFERGAVFDSIRFEVRVTAADPHYEAYHDLLREDITIRSRNAAQGLEGAYGLFGALASSTRSIMIIRDPPPDTTPAP